MNFFSHCILSVARFLWPDQFLSRNDREIRRVRRAIVRESWKEDLDPIFHRRNQRRARVLCFLLARRGQTRDDIERESLISRYNLSI